MPGHPIPAVPPTVTQAEAEAGTNTDRKIFTAQRVAQAISALAGSGGKIAQVKVGISSSETSTTLALPLDNTSPQSTEMATATNVTFTPTDSSNHLWFIGVCNVGASGALKVASALFPPTGSSAVQVSSGEVPGSFTIESLPIVYRVPVSTYGTSSQTWTLRFGGDTAGTKYLNRCGNHTWTTSNSSVLIMIEIDES